MLEQFSKYFKKSADVSDWELKPFRTDTDGHVIEGILVADDESWVPIWNGVPVFLSPCGDPELLAFADRYGLIVPKGMALTAERIGQDKTASTFSDKWRRFKNYGMEEEHQKFLQSWYCQKLGLPDLDALKSFYKPFKTILEVGPGSGFNVRFMAENCDATIFALDISQAAETTFENTRDLSNVAVVRADLMEPPFPNGMFDFIIADGVLHHTPNTRVSMERLYRLLKPSGKFFFYVYREMGPARKWADDFIRSKFTALDPEECYDAVRGLTELGRELAKLNAKVRLNTPIDVLGIPSGTHDVQRLLYYNFVKCFWNDAFDFETNNMVNFDWYHPHFAWQHTQAEVAAWLDELGVQEYIFNDANPNGLSVLLEKPGSV